MEFILVTGYAAIFLWLIKTMSFFKTGGIKIKYFQLAFVLKIVCGWLMSLIYTYYYKNRVDADIFRYFDDSKILYESVFINFKHFLKMFFSIDTDNPELFKYYDQMITWDARHSNIVIRVNALIRFFSQGNYLVHIVFINFFSLLGLTGIYRAFEKAIPEKRHLLFIAVFFIPSVLFWTSGVLKDSIAMFAFGIIFYELISKKEHTHLSIGVTIFCVFILLLSKAYILFLFLPGLIAFKLAVNRTQKSWQVFLLIHLIFIGILTVSGFVDERLNVLNILAEKQSAFLELAHKVNAQSTLDVTILKPDILTFLKALPEALVNTLLRPFIWESSSPLILMSALENLLIYLLISMSFLFKITKIHNRQLLYFIFSFVILNALLTGLTAPVLGAIVRYRIFAILFLSIACVLVIDQKKLLNQLNRFWKRS